MESVAERKRKFLMVVPLFAVPVLCLMFYGLGGGKSKQNNGHNILAGLNTSLPGAQLEDKGPMDKLAMYEQADKDARTRKDRSEIEGYNMPDSGLIEALADGHSIAATLQKDSMSRAQAKKEYMDGNELKIARRLEVLQKVVAAGDTATIPKPPGQEALYQPEVAQRQIDSVMASLQQPVTAADPQLSKLDAMLEKIIDIQHPERIQEKLKTESVQNKSQIFPISNAIKKEGDDLVEQGSDLSFNTRSGTGGVAARLSQNTSNGFYDLNNTPDIPASTALQGVIHESKTVVSGETIKIRLLQDAYIQGQLIRAGAFVFGRCELSGDRLSIKIPSILVDNNVYPVSLQVYDTDGLPGISIPGSITRDASKEGSQQALQALSMGSLDPSVGAQAAAAGIETAKNLLSKKVRLVKVQVKADHPVLLVSQQ
ncbi:conjugative transposon protein TraM [[Flexibacter] sp. ATCC 35208]|uniref:conjugative transposon protein TraM n=1 Tax=[Flexibacter] sp. ATCC 35208 TaxID=1936242 RepID=UPI0009CE4204|nr:conjugative transposon protein TraM [[Flexibacter] sp. ATCC 35208]OMP80092.1 conjugative transposon protein TraM [[Flexibacter] sp. ATCC 35208]